MMKTRKTICILQILLAVNVLTFANPVEKRLLSQYGEMAFRQKATTLCPSAASSSLKNVQYFGDSNQPLLAVLNFDNGFLKVSQNHVTTSAADAQSTMFINSWQSLATRQLHRNNKHTLP